MMNNLWFKDVVMYELYVKSFKDSSNDGCGDINGLISKLDYLKELGITCIVLLPIYPSPGKDDGYDIEDYYAIDPLLGTIKDFKKLLWQAHAIGIKVIIDLVINYTSDTHRWFIEASKGSDNPFHNFYIWSDTPEKYNEAEIIYSEYEHSNWTYQTDCKKYYFHMFNSYEPDLNYDNPKVRDEIKKILKYWFDLGVDGIRFDDLSYLFNSEGIKCKNSPKTHDFIKELRNFVDANYVNSILIGRVNQLPDEQAKYFGDGDELHMISGIPGKYIFFPALKEENWEGLFDFAEKMPVIPENCQWVLPFMDQSELILGMITTGNNKYIDSSDEKEYSVKRKENVERRIAPLFDNNQDKMELIFALLFAAPGSPIIYYGEEIGMGDNIYLGNRKGLRTPMQWNDKRNAGFSDCVHSKLSLPVTIDPEYHYFTVNVEVQKNKMSSIYNYVRRLIDCWKKYKSFGGGEFILIPVLKKKIISIMRNYEDETIISLFNLSNKPQRFEIDLSDYEGIGLVDIFDDIDFPQITEYPYIVTLNSYSFHFLKFVENEVTSW